MTRSVDEVEGIILTIVLIIHLDRVALDGDTFLLLKVHRIQHLVFHVSGCESVGYLQHSVSQGTLTMVNMRNNAEISCLLHIQL